MEPRHFAGNARARGTMSSPSTKPSSQLTPAIELRRVSKLFGSFVALRDVSLMLSAGSSVMLLGPNGAGKSTLLKLLAGLARPSYGDVFTLGESPTTMRGRVAYMGHSTMLYDELTGPENLNYLLGLQRPKLSATQREQHVTAALAAVGLDPGNPRRLGEYSQGMRQRAALARVLLTAPEILLLDEPFSNLDVSSVEMMIARLHRYMSDRPDGTLRTLLLTTHQAELARPLVQRTLTLRDGRLTEDDSSSAPRVVAQAIPERPAL